MTGPNKKKLLNALNLLYDSGYLTEIIVSIIENKINLKD